MNNLSSNNNPPFDPEEIRKRVENQYLLTRKRAIQEDARNMLAILPIAHKTLYDIDSEGNLIYIGDYKRPMSEKYDWHNPMRNKPVPNVSQPVVFGDLVNNDGFDRPNVRINYDHYKQSLNNKSW